MSFTIIAFEVVLNPLDQIRLAIAQANHASKVRGGRMSTVVVSNLEVGKLLPRWVEVGAWLFLCLLVQRCCISILLGVLQFSWQEVVIHLLSLSS
jgi:hypothetical protein